MCKNKFEGTRPPPPHCFVLPCDRLFIALLSLYYAATVPVAIAQTISIELDQGELSYFEYQIPDEGMTVILRRKQGSASLYASNKVQNPNAAFFDYIIEEEGDFFVDLGLLLSGGGVTVFSNTTLFVSVEGISDVVSSFQILTTVGNSEF